MNAPDTVDFLTDFTPTTIQPEAIQRESFSIIDQEIGQHAFTPTQYPIVQRVIHTSADFELGKSLLFHPDAVSAGVIAISAGKSIIVDVHMIRVGVHQPRLQSFGCQVESFITDADVAAEANRLNTTRALAAVRKAADLNRTGIFAIGNAPTALLELIRLIKLGRAKPDLVIGLPVGFVSAVESKEELARLNVPFITNTGRKGGSLVTVAVINALAIMAAQS